MLLRYKGGMGCSYYKGLDKKRLGELENMGYFIPPHYLVKSHDEIEGIRKSGKLTKEVLDIVGDRIKEGVTTNEIDRWVYDYTIEHGGYPAPLNYEGFPKSVCTSINDVICHGIPDDTVLKEGDIINIDVSTILDGYYSDASRMFIIGSITKEALQLVNTSKECLNIGMGQVKAYNSFNLIGNAIEKHAKSNGFSVVRDYCGHGVGLEFHEEPQVDHYAKRDKGLIMLPGMVFTIEPMINAGKYRCKTLSNGWTVVTADGSLSSQWEHTIAVTENGFDILTI